MRRLDVETDAHTDAEVSKLGNSCFRAAVEQYGAGLLLIESLHFSCKYPVSQDSRVQIPSSAPCSFLVSNGSRLSQMFFHQSVSNQHSINVRSWKESVKGRLRTLRQSQYKPLSGGLTNWVIQGKANGNTGNFSDASNPSIRHSLQSLLS